MLIKSHPSFHFYLDIVKNWQHPHQLLWFVKSCSDSLDFTLHTNTIHTTMCHSQLNNSTQLLPLPQSMSVQKHSWDDDDDDAERFSQRRWFIDLLGGGRRWGWLWWSHTVQHLQHSTTDPHQSCESGTRLAGPLADRASLLAGIPILSNWKRLVNVGVAVFGPLFIFPHLRRKQLCNYIKQQTSS